MPDPESLLKRFLVSLSGADLTALVDCFSADATAFFPAEHERRLVRGRDAIGRSFAAVLARLQAAGLERLSFEPVDLVVQSSGSLALATFHLCGEHLSRRTFVMHREAEQWRIVHLHASNARWEEGPAGHG